MKGEIVMSKESFVDAIDSCLDYIIEDAYSYDESLAYKNQVIDIIKMSFSDGWLPAFKELTSTGVFHDAIGYVCSVSVNNVITYDTEY